MVFIFTQASKHAGYCDQASGPDLEGKLSSDVVEGIYSMVKGSAGHVYAFRDSILRETYLKFPSHFCN